MIYTLYRHIFTCIYIYIHTHIYSILSVAFVVPFLFSEASACSDKKILK